MVVRLTRAIALAAILGLVLALPVAADAPVELGPFVDIFEDIDPCTSETHTVTISSTVFAHEHGDRIVAHGVRTLTTSSGYEGRGTSAYVFNGQVELNPFTDILTNAETGDRIRASGIFVLDLSTDTVRTERFVLTCVGG